jgi:hypothetical protein
VKTTVEISDALFREARRVAAREGVTFRTLVERGLQRVVGETKRGRSFKRRRASFKGSGLQSRSTASSAGDGGEPRRGYNQPRSLNQRSGRTALQTMRSNPHW